MLDTPSFDWRENALTAAELAKKEFPDVAYIIDGLIPEGLTLLAGKPKIGKSWLALDVCNCVASGQPVLGGVTPDQGDVLYCALEDTHRRLKRRMLKIADGSWSERLTLVTDWRRLDAGGVDDIADWADSVSNPRLVVLDTLAGVRPKRDGKDTTYDGDYSALVEAHRLANDGGYGIMVLHHTRKADSLDPLDSISGTLGQIGCADTGLVLARNTRGTTLYVRGRDVEESEFALAFNNSSCRWTLLGDAAEHHRSDTRRRILEALDDAPELMRPVDIARVTGINRNAVDRQLGKMVKDGEIVKLGTGRYSHPSKAGTFK